MNKYNQINKTIPSLMHKKKKQLIQVLGTYDSDAKLNQQKITRYKTEIYDRQIDLSQRVETWNEEVFEPKLFGVHLLSHPFLNDNIMFKEIKEAFSQYNKEVLGIETKINQEHVRSVKMRELLKIMINIIEIDNKQIQISSLKKAHKWMKDNLKEEPDKYQSIKNQQKPSVVANNIKVQLPRLPSHGIQEEIRDYKNHFRTVHDKPPKDRIKHYKRRQLNFDDSFKIITKDIKEIKANKIKYIRPKSNFGFDIQEEPQEQVVYGEDGVLLEVLEPGIENLLAPQPPMVQFDNQNQEEEVEPQLPQEDDKVGKLNPRTKLYTYPDQKDYQKSQTILQQRFKLQTTKSENQSRQDYQSNLTISKLASRKSRFQSQLSRKLQSLKQMTKMAKLQTNSKLRSLTQTNYPVKDITRFKTQTSILQSPYEQLSNQLSVKQVKKATASSLSYIQGDIPNQREGLSMFGKKKHYQNKKWLSLILKQHQSNQELQHSLDEIEDIKIKLTQDRVPFQLKKIFEGIVKPSQLTSQAMTTIGQPQGRLLSNPDFKVGKKKKKKKKK